MNSYLIILISSAVGLACLPGLIRPPDQPKDPKAKTLRVHNTWTTFSHSRSGTEAVLEEASGEPQNTVVLVNTAPTAKQESNPTEFPPKKQSQVGAPPTVDRSPIAEKVVGKPGYVFTPFIEERRIVDVVNVRSGTKVKCPYTMKIFRVP